MPKLQAVHSKKQRTLKKQHVPTELSAEQREAIARVVHDPRSTQDRVIDSVIDRLMNELDDHGSPDLQQPK